MSSGLHTLAPPCGHLQRPQGIRHEASTGRGTTAGWRMLTRTLHRSSSLDRWELNVLSFLLWWPISLLSHCLGELRLPNRPFWIRDRFHEGHPDPMFPTTSQPLRIACIWWSCYLLQRTLLIWCLTRHGWGLHASGLSGRFPLEVLLGQARGTPSGSLPSGARPIDNPAPCIAECRVWILYGTRTTHPFDLPDSCLFSRGTSTFLIPLVCW